MNFLLHRHFAAIELGSPAAGIGAMLPDLWRLADRRVRPREPSAERTDPALATGEDAQLAEILAGIEHHVAIDRWFHATPELIDGERMCASLLRASAPAALRAGLFAHVTWEMALDGALVETEGLETVRRALEQGFAATEAARREAVAAHHFDRVPRAPEDRAAFDLHMGRIIAELVRAGGDVWIDSYRTGIGLAACLSGIRTRLGLGPIDRADRARLAAALDEVASEASRALGSLLARRGAAALASRALAT